MKSNKPHIVFISGYGRSGSTILDSVLGQLPGVVALGEIRHVWERGLLSNHLCACGVPFDRCEFWSEVIRDAFGAVSKNDIEYFVRLASSVDKPKYIPFLVTKVSKKYEERKIEYRAILEQLYSSIIKVSSANVIVDSSKTPSHGFLLRELQAFELNVLHLMRDSRATAYSWTKVKVRPEVYWKKELMPQYSVLRSSVWWGGANLASEILTDSSKGDVRLIYEELCKSPKAKIANFLYSFGLSELNEYIEDALNGVIENTTSHSVSGNPNRFMGQRVNIRCDSDWKNNMSFTDKFMTTLLTFPLLFAYGYVGIKSDD